MKKIVTYAILFFVALSFAACGNKQEDKKGKFNPIARASQLSLEEREAAIEAKRQSLLPVDIDSLMVSHGVKFSIMPPAVSENVPLSASDKLTNKMIQIAAKNGIGGLCTNPVLAMVSKVDCIDRSVTGTAP